MTTKITKNVYSCNNNVCLGVCMMVFMRIVPFEKIFQYERGYLRVFKSIITLKNY